MKRIFGKSVAALVLLLASMLAFFATAATGAEAHQSRLVWWAGIWMTLSFLALLCTVWELRRIRKSWERAKEKCPHLDFQNEMFQPEHIDLLLTRLDELEASYDSELVTKYLKNQAEIAVLQSQINPHFLYNTLDTIRGLAMLEHVPNIAEMAEALAKIFRYNINSTQYMSSLQSELHNVDNYMKIQSYRFANKFQLVTAIDKDAMEFQMPRMSLQPIVENALHHGLELKRGKGSICIRAYRTQDTLIVRVHDDGVGMSAAELEALQNRIESEESLLVQRNGENSYKQHAGIALVNINKRIKLAFGRQYGLSISSVKGEGTFVEMILPLVEEGATSLAYEKENF